MIDFAANAAATAAAKIANAFVRNRDWDLPITSEERM